MESKQKQKGASKKNASQRMKKQSNPGKSGHVIDSPKGESSAPGLMLKKNFVPYGPPVLPISPNKVGDETISASLTVDTQHVCHLVIGLLNQAGASLDETNSGNTFSYAYAYKFLVIYLQNAWTGVPQVYDLNFAPKVFWDLVDAGMPKRGKGHNLQFSGRALADSAIPNPTSALFGTALGTASGSTLTSGYMTIDSSLASYTDLLGYNAARSIFNSSGRAMDCATREQYTPRIKDDDFSFYAFCSQKMSTTIADRSYLVNGNRFSAYQECLGPSDLCRTPWLARVACTIRDDTSHPWILAPEICTTSSPPAAYIGHRMLNRLSGRYKAKQEVIIKPVDASTFLFLVDKLIARVEVLAGSNAVAFNNADCFMNSNDVKYLLCSYLQSIFAKWAPVGTGFQVGIAGQWRPTARAGPSDIANTYLRGMHIPHILAKGLSCLVPYTRERGRQVFYPVWFYDADTTMGNASYAVLASGLLQATWNILSNFIAAGSTEAADGVGSTIVSLQARWNIVISRIQAYIPFGPVLEEPLCNLACMTRFENPTTSQYMGLSFEDAIPPDVFDLATTSILPFVKLNSALADQAWRGHFQDLYGEHKFIGAPRTGVDMATMIYDNIIQTTHIGNVGDPSALNDEDRQEVSYLDGVKSLVTTTVGAATGQALLNAVPGATHLASSLVGAGLLRRGFGRAYQQLPV